MVAVALAQAVQFLVLTFLSRPGFGLRNAENMNARIMARTRPPVLSGVGQQHAHVHSRISKTHDQIIMGIQQDGQRCVH